MRRRVEIIGENAQLSAGLGHDADLAHRNLHRILAALCLAGRQEADPVVKDAGARIELAIAGADERRIALEAGHDAAAGGVKLRPPGIIVIAETEDIGRTGLEGRRHRMIDWAGKVGIIDDMGLCAANLGREPRGQSRAARDLAAGI